MHCGFCWYEETSEGKLTHGCTVDFASMRRCLRDNSLTGEQPLPSINEHPLHGGRRPTHNRSSRSFYPKRWRSFSALRATAPHARQSSQGRFLRWGKRRADQPIYASSIGMRPCGRLWSNTSEVQDLVYLLLDEWCDGKFKDGKPETEKYGIELW